MADAGWQKADGRGRMTKYMSLVRESLLAPFFDGNPFPSLKSLVLALPKEGITATKRCEKGFSLQHAALRPGTRTQILARENCHTQGSFADTDW